MSPFTPPGSIPHQEDLQHQILDLDLDDMESLLAWLKAMVKDRRHEAALNQIPLKKGREVVETVNTGKTTYRLERVKCGKKKCKCSTGKLHGPYWYAYSWNGKKLSSTYIGKNLNKEILDQ